jgi:predicted nucleotidyltransferase
MMKTTIINNLSLHLGGTTLMGGAALALTQLRNELFGDYTEKNYLCRHTMDRTTLTRQQALDVVREYKRVISPHYSVEPKVMMYGSYARGYANPDSDIDVAVIVPEPEITDHWEQWADLWGDVRKVNVLIEPVLMEDNEDSPLYREVMRTGVAV